MPITRLEPTAALIIIDLQQAIAALPLTTPLVAILKNTNRLAHAFRQSALPVVSVVAGSVFVGRNDHGRTVRSMDLADTELLAGLHTSDGDHRIRKSNWGAFTGTDLEMFLRKRGVSQLVVVGVATSIGVESTVRHAVELGFNIAVATDGVADISADCHDYSLRKILPKISETGTTIEILKALERALAGTEARP